MGNEALIAWIVIVSLIALAVFAVAVTVWAFWSVLRRPKAVNADCESNIEEK